MFRSEVKEKHFYTTFTIKNIKLCRQHIFCIKSLFLAKTILVIFFTNPIKTLARTEPEAESITIHNDIKQNKKKLFPDAANQNISFCSFLVMGKPSLFSRTRFTAIFTVS